MAEVILFGAVLSLDSLGVGLACGIKSVKMPVCIRLYIAAATVILAAAVCVAGELLSRLLPPVFAKTVCSILLVCTGIVMLAGSLHSRADGGDGNDSGVIEPAEAWLLGFTLSADMLSAGTGFALEARYLFLFPASVGLFQFLFLSIGIAGGKRINFPAKQLKITQLLPGAVIIILGLVKFII